MKKIQLRGKLNLQKEVITRLNEHEMKMVEGGLATPKTKAGTSSPCNPQTCPGDLGQTTCLYINGC